MFNKKDASFEIEKAMEKLLVSNAAEKESENINKFAKALDYLNCVAEIFDELGLPKEAEATTNLLEIVTAKKKVKKSKPNGSTKGLTSKKMIKNLKEKGWVFNADDGHKDHCMCSMCMDVNDNDFEDEDDFDDEEDTLVKKHHVMLPPPMEDEIEMPEIMPYSPDTDSWRDIEETAKDTIRPAKYKK